LYPRDDISVRLGLEMRVTVRNIKMKKGGNKATDVITAWKRKKKRFF
jgi:hypothetical protein